MTSAAANHHSNVVLGSGELYIDTLDADDGLTGERFLGDAVGATVSLTTERTTIQSGTGQIAQDLVDIVRSVSRQVGFTVRDMSIANWRAFIIGDDGSAADRQVAVTNDEVEAQFIGDVKAGTFVQIGASPANPSGVGQVGEASDRAAEGKTSLKSGTTGTYGTAGASAGNPVAQEGKWKLDRQAGRIEFLSDLEGVAVTYTPVARTIHRAIAGGDARQLTCALRYIEDTGSGDGRNLFVRKCNLVPGGEVALMSRDTEQQLSFTATVQQPPAGWPWLTIDDLPLNPAA